MALFQSNNLRNSSNQGQKFHLKMPKSKKILRLPRNRFKNQFKIDNLIQNHTKNNFMKSYLIKLLIVMLKIKKKIFNWSKWMKVLTTFKKMLQKFRNKNQNIVIKVKIPSNKIIYSNMRKTRKIVEWILQDNYLSSSFKFFSLQTNNLTV